MVKYGFAGRVLLGPKGGPGTVSFPVNIRVAGADQRTLATDRMVIATTIPHNSPVGYFSMVREIAFPLGAWYHASKHALEAYSDALRQEVKRFGVDVVLIQPGLIKTEFGGVTSDGVREYSGQGAYRELAEALAESTDALYSETSKASEPSVVASTIRKAVETARPRPRYPVGYMAKPLLALNRFLPARLFDRVATSQVS